MTATITAQTTVITRKTAHGWMAMATSNDTLLALTFAHPTPQAALRSLPSVTGGQCEQNEWPVGEGNSRQSERLAARLEKFLDGAMDDFLDVTVDVSWSTPFQAAVIDAVRRIPFGQTRTYGDIAAAAGSPRAARAVGNIMAGNRTPLVVPCHRVVASSGMGGFSARGGLRTKLRLLETEHASAARP